MFALPSRYRFWESISRFSFKVTLSLLIVSSSSDRPYLLLKTVSNVYGRSELEETFNNGYVKVLNRSVMVGLGHVMVVTVTQTFQHQNSNCIKNAFTILSVNLPKTIYRKPSLSTPLARPFFWCSLLKFSIF